MVENLGRKLTLIFSLMAVSVAALFIGGFRLGLDLRRSSLAVGREGAVAELRDLTVGAFAAAGAVF